MSHQEGNITYEQRQIYRKQAQIRAGSRIRQLVKENNLRYMWSLSYELEVTDRDKALLQYKNFIKRLNYHVGEKIHYVAVIEVQTERFIRTGIAVLHFHMAINKYIDKHQLQEIWSHGNVWVTNYENGKPVKGKSSVATYMSKYLKKDMESNPDEQIAGKKMYLSSRGLKRPNAGYGVATDEQKKQFWDIANNFNIAEGVNGSSLNIDKYMKA